MSLYTELISSCAPGHDPRHIEAWMRIEHGTLSHLSKEQFEAEIKIAVHCIEQSGHEESESLALSYGL